jgi:import inner membrane translocase subunit TIM21
MMNRVTVPGLRIRPAAWHSNTIIAQPLSQLVALQLPRYYPSRHYATQHQQSSTPESRRRAVTPFNDDGHVPWTQLSAGEKTARAAQQTFNFGMVILGMLLTVCSPL